MKTFVRVVAGAMIAAGITAGPAFADSHEGNQPKLVKTQFDTPVSFADVKRDWEARGYYTKRYDAEPGWAQEEHYHGFDRLLTVVEGRLEMTIEGQRFVLEPGDEIFTPHRAVNSKRNLHDGFTMFLYGPTLSSGGHNAIP